MIRRQARRLGGVFAVCLVLGIARGAAAHTSLPAYLEMTEVAPGSFELVWRVPAAEGPPPAIYPVLPPHCVTPDDPSETAAPASVLVRGIVHCGAGGLIGHTIEIEGLRVTIMDVLVRIVFADGTSVSKILRGQEPGFTVGVGGGGDAFGYARLGVEHILTGIDHLLFVTGLLLIVRGSRRLLKAITAFTAAHSITLGLAAFGVVRLPTVPIEAVISLSLVFLAVEMAEHERGHEGLSYTHPWVVAFAFGLLHGFGFAGTLSEIGIPPREIPLALLSFNLGVEAGQVAFIGVFVAFMAGVRTLDIRVPRWTAAFPSYAIGSLASYWFLQRCALLFRP